MSTGQDSWFQGTYTLHEYGDMFLSPARSQAYSAAIRAAVRPGDVVVDLGAGVGLSSVLACQAGARRVYAIEASPLVRMAPRFAADNGVADRLVCIEALSTQVELPEPADVLVTDLRGMLPFYQGSVNSIVDARRRFLRPGGLLVPMRDSLFATVVAAPELHESIVQPWRDGAEGLHLQHGLEPAVNTVVPVMNFATQALADPVTWATLQYATIDTGPVGGDGQFRVQEPGVGHGVLVWFDAELMPGIGFSSAPDAPPTPYGQAFFPWPAAVHLETGAGVHVRFRVIPGLADAIWAWDTQVTGADGKVIASFQQSTFRSEPFSQRDLQRRAHTHTPVLSRRGQVTRDVLAWLDGRRSLGEIATMLQDRYPARFPDWHAALAQAAEISTAQEPADGERE